MHTSELYLEERHSQTCNVCTAQTVDAFLSSFSLKSKLYMFYIYFHLQVLLLVYAIYQFRLLACKRVLLIHRYTPHVYHFQLLGLISKSRV